MTPIANHLSVAVGTATNGPVFRAISENVLEFKAISHGASTCSIGHAKIRIGSHQRIEVAVFA